MTQRIVLDGDGLIDPDAALAWSRANGYELVGLAAYAYGSGISLCVDDGRGGFVVNPRAVPWLARCKALELKVVVVWELSASAAEGGAPQGTLDGQRMLACLRALGVPFGGATAYFTNDSEVTDWNAVVGYFWAVAKVCQASKDLDGVYGQAIVFEKVGLARLWKASDGTNDVPRGTVLLQGRTLDNTTLPQPVIAGLQCDIDIVLADDFGGWDLNPSSPPPPHKPPIPEDDMFTFVTCNDHAKLPHPDTTVLDWVVTPTGGKIAVPAAGITAAKAFCQRSLSGDFATFLAACPTVR